MDRLGFVLTDERGWRFDEFGVLIGHRRGYEEGGADQAFLFVDDTYLGQDLFTTSHSIRLTGLGDDVVRLEYATFDREDDDCCPSGAQEVTFFWNGDRVEALDPIPPNDPDVDGSRRGAGRFDAPTASEQDS